MAVVRLNVDVLAIICDFLTDVSHILSFALACSTLHAVAIRRLLSMRPIYLGKTSSIRQFHSFVFADKPARARHIHALEIGSWPHPHRLPEATPAEDDPLLIDILNQCPHLECISVVLRAVSPQRTNNPRISDVIANIQSLRSLSVHGNLADMVAFFNEIRAPLRMLGIHCTAPEAGHWSTTALEEVLPRFAPTLEKLELATFYSYPYVSGRTIPIPSRDVFRLTQYPDVRSFSVTAFQGMPSLEHLQHLFPALDGTLSLSLFSVWALEDNFASVRAANQRAQDKGTEPSSCPWTKLARVACSAHMFYVLGLRCPIGLVMIDRTSKYTKRYLVAALREQPVHRLELSLVLSRGLEVFDELFPPELGDTLTHLTLFCDESQYGGASTAQETASLTRHWNDIIDRLRASLQDLHGLTHLRVVMHFILRGREAVSPETEYSEAYMRALRGPAFEHAEKTAASLIHALPSLEYVFLTAAGRIESGGFARSTTVSARWHTARAWRVEPPTDGTKGKGGSPVLVALHEEVAETIIRKEELILSKPDEAVLYMRGDVR